MHSFLVRLVSLVHSTVKFSLFSLHHPSLPTLACHELEIQTKGDDYRIANLLMAAVSHTRTLGDNDGFMKALVGADGDRILGFTTLENGAGELLPVCS